MSWAGCTAATPAHQMRSASARSWVTVLDISPCRPGLVRNGCAANRSTQHNPARMAGLFIDRRIHRRQTAGDRLLERANHHTIDVRFAQAGEGKCEPDVGRFSYAADDLEKLP